MAQGAQRIGPTAHYTAHVWRRVGLPYAEHFSTGRGALYYWGFAAMGEWMFRWRRSAPSMREYLECRHRLIDAVVQRERPGVLVEVGAGLSRRAVMWAADHDVPGIEVDLPAMAALKRRQLAAAPEPLRLRLQARHAIHDGDLLSPQFCSSLAGWIREHTRPVVVVEGVLGYFDAAPRRRAVEAIGKALRQAGGGTMVCSLHTATAQARTGWSTTVRRTAARVLTRRSDALLPFADLAAVRQTFARAGFDHCAPVTAPTYADFDPRLATLRSYGHVIVARVRPGSTASCPGTPGSEPI